MMAAPVVEQDLKLLFQSLCFRVSETEGFKGGNCACEEITVPGTGFFQIEEP